MSDWKFYKLQNMATDLIHDLRHTHNISVNDLLAYIIWYQRLYHKNEYETIFVLDGKKYKVSIKEF